MSEVCPSKERAPLPTAREDERARRTALRAVEAQARPRRLLLCLDGVPFELVKQAQSRGLFENFRAPARLLSPFPTLTNVALAQMLRASPPNGYESLYFDREAREQRGGISKYIGRRTPDKVPSSYMDELDYQEPLHFEFLIYVATDKIWRADMGRFRERFLAAPPARDFFGFIKATDGLLHLQGPERLLVALRSLDAILREIQTEAGTETEIVVFSDHGMNLQENRRVHLQTHLRRCGYEFVRNMRRPRGRRRVSVPGFGLCGYAALYCGEETDRAELSDALRQLEGVDFSVYREGDDAAIVASARGSARIRRARRGDATLYAYEQTDGDPLALSEVAREMRDAGLFDERGFAPESEWLARTWGHEYPDAVANIFESVHTPRVRHTADVLVSIRDGYYYGASAFERIVSIKATHGNAQRPSSTAFMMSTHRALPPYVRSTEARPLLRD
jgi:hypothetical protein